MGHDYPPDVLYAIASAVSAAAEPTAPSSLDPLYLVPPSVPRASPSSYPGSYWSEQVSRKTLASLCLVSKDFREAARPWLWHRLEVNIPRSWLGILNEVCGEDPVEPSSQSVVPEPVLPLVLDPCSLVTVPENEDPFTRLHRDSFVLPCGSIPLELLTPPVSRDPSPARLRSASPGRWRLIRAVNHRSEPGLYVPTPIDPSPGRYVRHLDFNHFRTIGMRRYVGDGFHSRFVTAKRLENLLKELPNLTAFGATEFMDSAISTDVLSELFLRGSSMRPIVRGRGAITSLDDDEDDVEERRADYKAIQAIDLCGCISSVFVGALQHFVESQGLGVFLVEGGLSRPRRSFSGLKRLGLRGVTSVPPDILTALVCSFPSLTHIDLSGTRCTPELLDILGASSTLRLESVALARCTRLTSGSIVSFLTEGRSTQNITELSLYGDLTFPSCLTGEDLLRIVTDAPCFKSGRLVYLDLSSAPINPAILIAFPAQPCLRSLGLSHIPTLPLHAIPTFLLDRAPNVEILTLISTTPELSIRNAREVSLAIHSRLIKSLCLPPFYLSVSPFPVSITSTSDDSPAPRAPTRLRVIEFSSTTLACLGGGAGSWRVVKSRGGRAWYVDTACAWLDGIFTRDLDARHPVREEVIRLAACDGNVVGSGSVGWHSRKMEILHGQGMLGREDGLYGAVAFAYMG